MIMLPPLVIEPTKKRFLTKVALDPVTNCWNWTGYRMKNGYALLYVHALRAKVLIHRVAWLLFKGGIPDGLCVLHHCDNRRCGNPEHLFLGDNQDNQDDCRAKGRHNWLRGESLPMTKLTTACVIQIKQRLADGEPWARIAKDFPVHKDTIRAIRDGKSWRWL